MKSNNKKEEIIALARELFVQKGFKNVSLSEIGASLSIRPASIYYYFPEGKEQLYLRSQESELSKYKSAMHEIFKKCNCLKQFLLDFSFWYSKQPPMNMEVINQIDMPQLSKRGQNYMKQIIYQCVFGPLNQSIEHFSNQLKTDINPRRLTGVYFSLLDSVSMAVGSGYDTNKHAMHESILMLLDGVLA